MPNSPVSGRKVREAAGQALASTNLQAEMLKGLIDKHNGLTRDTADTFTKHANAINDHELRMQTLESADSRGFFGRLKFLVLGK
jgi:hypothetical protein